MKIDHFDVRHPILQKYVDYYYLLSTVEDSGNTSYLAFPSCQTPLGFFKYGAPSISTDGIIVRFTPSNILTCSIVGNFRKPLKISIEPNILEFSVVFKPLGVNYFVKQNLGEVMRETVSPVAYFDDLLPIAGQIVDGIDALREFEDGLAEKFHPNRQLATLQSVITIFQESEISAASQSFLNDFGISHKRLFRLFKSQVGLNPTQYRNLLRFRKAMELSMQNLDQNLTDAGHTAGYYDQPHFIREFRKITNQTPKEFLSKISLENNDKIVWQFLSKTSDSYN